LSNLYLTNFLKIAYTQIKQNKSYAFFQLILISFFLFINAEC